MNTNTKELKEAVFKTEFSSKESLKDYLARTHNEDEALEELRKLMVYAKNNLEELLQDVKIRQYAKSDHVRENEKITLIQAAYEVGVCLKTFNKLIVQFNLEVQVVSRVCTLIRRGELKKITKKVNKKGSQ